MMQRKYSPVLAGRDEMFGKLAEAGDGLLCQVRDKDVPLAILPDREITVLGFQ